MPMKHTDGPWYYELAGGTLVSENHRMAITLHKSAFDQTHTLEWCANKDLICAAPKMLKALEPAELILKNIEYVHPKIDDSAEVHISIRALRAMVDALKEARGPLQSS